MRILDQADTARSLSFPPLIDAISQMFTSGCVMPVRHHHTIEVPGEREATLLLMPAWQPSAYIGVKLVSVFPDNQLRSLPAIHGSYLLSSGKTGELLAVIDGGELTARRTAATSALAARHLARADASTLLVVGTGRLSLNLIEAHSHVRPIEKVMVWGRDFSKAQAVVAEARGLGYAAEAVSDLETAARSADILSCATLSHTPLIWGAWLKPGSHLDLVGAFRKDMRESDDKAVKRASLFVDTRAGAFAEAGDLLQPLEAGVITRADIKAELVELVSGTAPGRQSAGEITLFKSVGAALEDLAGAILAYETVSGGHVLR
ncbi:ornithine cyclodeaminase [Rhizobium sp. Root274]|uniref:ornithine cyclodeaminase family protein n=1 Tax=unclassified Rhizobium TaxID=2613769 RepID=UPI000713CDED|nr:MULTISPECIES: ornithine cyclodeaminase family protein [unclassified Rhizobium]KQW27780.1 ornithine cyclodeaminase [Rhizobium sp. Root1240]KRD28059.1 ornithine cyclodeaminase [Rhizobium sp. Root274]